MSKYEITVTIVNLESFDPDEAPKEHIKLSKTFEIGRTISNGERLVLDKTLGFFRIDLVYIDVENNITHIHSLREDYSDESYNKDVELLKNKGWVEI